MFVPGTTGSMISAGKRAIGIIDGFSYANLTFSIQFVNRPDVIISEQVIPVKEKPI
jgi:hypothetical protein